MTAGETAAQTIIKACAKLTLLSVSSVMSEYYKINSATYIIMALLWNKNTLNWKDPAGANMWYIVQCCMEEALQVTLSQWAGA